MAHSEEESLGSFQASYRELVRSLGQPLSRPTGNLPEQTIEWSVAREGVVFQLFGNDYVPSPDCIFPPKPDPRESPSSPRLWILVYPKSAQEAAVASLLAELRVGGSWYPDQGPSPMPGRGKEDVAPF